MPRRGTRDAEWLLHKDKILHLYLTDGNSLDKVRHLMETEENFKRSKAQYERWFKIWDAKKNSKAEVWKFVRKRLEQRGGRSAVEIRGELISDDRVKEKVRRCGPETTMERIKSRHRIHLRSPTPPGVRVFTPPGSPFTSHVELMIIGNASLMHPNPSFIEWTDEDFAQLSEATPWSAFLRLMQSLSLNRGDETLFSSLSLFPSHDQSSYVAIDELGRRESQIVRNSGSLKTWIDNTLCALYTEDLVGLPVAWTNPNAYLPPNRDCTAQIDMHAVIRASDRSTQLEFLKHATNFVANNFHTHDFASSIIDMLDDKHNLRLLRTLLSRNIGTTCSFAEKLISLAAEKGNIELVEILLQAGVDVNIQSPCDEYNYPSNRSPLQVAIRAGDSTMVQYLLSCGANIGEQHIGTNEILDRHYSYIYFDHILDYAVYKNNIDIVKSLLSYMTRVKHVASGVSMTSLNLALGNRNIEMFHILLDFNPSLCKRIQQEPWILLETSAIQGDLTTLSALLDFGLDVNKADHAGRGSTLAAAVASRCTNMSISLIERGMNVCNVTFGLRGEPTPQTPNVRQLWMITGVAPLHIAISIEEVALVRALLFKGADVDQCCNGIFPIQIAVSKGNEILVQLLIDEYADLNAVVAGPTRANVHPNFAKSHPNFADHEHFVGYPAARIALELGFESIFKLLVQNGATLPDSQEYICGWDPLPSSIVGGSLSLVKLVLERFPTVGRSLNIALATCILQFGSGLIRELLELGTLHPENVLSPEILFVSVYKHDIKFVQYLFAEAESLYGGLLPGHGVLGFTVAMLCGHFDMISTFLDYNIRPYEATTATMDPEILDQEWGGMVDLLYDIPKRVYAKESERPRLLLNLSPLSVALDRRYSPDDTPYASLSDVSILVDACVVPQRDTEEYTSWKLAIFESCTRAMEDSHQSLQVIQYLLSKSPDINWAPANMPTLLQTALKEANMGSFSPDAPVKVLLELNASPKSPACLSFSNLYHTPLQYACQMSRTDYFQLFLSQGADPNARPSFHRGATALQLAAMNGNFEILNILLKKGADINAAPGKCDGRTCIEGAAEHGRLDMVKYLLEAGADVRGKMNRNYRRTVYRAWKGGHRTIVKMIHDWKTEKYGPEDCDDFENIQETMSPEEEYFADHDAYVEYKEYRRRSSSEY